jgi:hypothetical protein
MKRSWSMIVSLAAGVLLACGTGTESTAEEPVAPAPPATESIAPVSAQSCTTLYRPRYTTYWASFPIEVDGQRGGCETFDDCSTVCWGEETQYVMHHDYFYCTYCY